MTTDATARPTNVPVRSTTSGGASAAGWPVISASEVAGRLSLEAAPTAADTRAAIGLDDHVPDVTGVAQTTAEQPSVENDAAADAGRHDHGDEVALPGRGTPPALGQRQRFRIVVHEGRYAGELLQPRPQGKLSPPTDVERRDGLPSRTHRSPATDTAHHDRNLGIDPVLAVGDVLDKVDQGLPQRLGILLTGTR